VNSLYEAFGIKYDTKLKYQYNALLSEYRKTENMGIVPQLNKLILQLKENGIEASDQEITEGFLL
jgi:hypothetical protein